MNRPQILFLDGVLDPRPSRKGADYFSVLSSKEIRKLLI